MLCTCYLTCFGNKYETLSTVYVGASLYPDQDLKEVLAGYSCIVSRNGGQNKHAERKSIIKQEALI